MDEVRVKAEKYQWPQRHSKSRQEIRQWLKLTQQGELALNDKLREGKETWKAAVLLDSEMSETK